MLNLIYIGLGGCIGAISRYLFSGWVYRLIGTNFPHGTLFVNVLGSFFLCWFVPTSLHVFNINPQLRAAITVGLCGAFTTFSTFSFETLSLLQDGQFILALVNVFSNVGLCLLAGWFGFVLSRLFI